MRSNHGKFPECGGGPIVTWSRSNALLVRCHGAAILSHRGLRVSVSHEAVTDEGRILPTLRAQSFLEILQRLRVSAACGENLAQVQIRSLKGGTGFVRGDDLLVVRPCLRRSPLRLVDAPEHKKSSGACIGGWVSFDDALQFVLRLYEISIFEVELSELCPCADDGAA